MRGVRFTKAERELLERLTDPAAFDWSCYGTGAVKAAASIRAKLTAALEAQPGLNIGPIQAALVAAAHGKVLELEGGHAIASRRAAAMKVTEDQARMVGEWMGRQTWLTTPMTILDVFNKWYQWLPKARATEPPPSFPSGLGPAGKTDGTGQGPAPAGKATPGRRTPQGFR